MAKTRLPSALGIIAACVLIASMSGVRAMDFEELSSDIVQADSLEFAIKSVNSRGASISHELGIIDADFDELTAPQPQASRATRAVTDGNLDAAGVPQLDRLYASLVEADRLHAERTMGAGVTVTLIDTGAL